MGAMSADEATTYDMGAVTPVLSLYREIDRADWARLASGLTQPLSETEIVQIRGLGDRLDMAEVAVASSSSTCSDAATSRASVTAATSAVTPSSVIEPSGAR